MGKFTIDVDLKEKIDSLSESFRQSVDIQPKMRDPYQALKKALEKDNHPEDAPALIYMLDKIGGLRSANEVNAGALEALTVRTFTDLVKAGVVHEVIETNSKSAADALVKNTIQQAIGDLSKNQIDHGILR